MNVDYFSLLSPEPFYIKGVGKVKPPKLRDICKIGINRYNLYISMLLLTKNKFLECLNEDTQSYENQDFLYVIFDKKEFVELYREAFSFFICENVGYSLKDKMFCTYVKSTDLKLNKQAINIVGNICNDNFDSIRNIILQFNYIFEDQFKHSKPHDKHTAELLKKRDMYRKKYGVNDQDASDLELGNIISKVATYGNNVNFINIWDFTIFQLYDQFFTINDKQSLQLQYTNFAVWGGDDNLLSEWYKNKFLHKKG